ESLGPRPRRGAKARVGSPAAGPATRMGRRLTTRRQRSPESRLNATNHPHRRQDAPMAEIFRTRAYEMRRNAALESVLAPVAGRLDADPLAVTETARMQTPRRTVRPWLPRERKHERSTAPNPSQFSRGWRLSANAPACISALPASAVCIT